MTRFHCLLILPVVLALSTTGAAQTTLPATPAANLCLIDPLDTGLLLDLVLEPLEASSEPVPTSEDASGSDIRAITEVVSETIACTNANQPLRSLALYTDRYLAERFSTDNGDELGHLIAATSRQPDIAADEDRLALIAVAGAVVLNDGRISALVTTSNATVLYTDILIFAETTDGWRIDRVIPGEETAASGTPGAASEDS